MPSQRQLQIKCSAFPPNEQAYSILPDILRTFSKDQGQKKGQK